MTTKNELTMGGGVGLAGRLLGVVIFMPVMGLIADACMGLPFSSSARSPGAWLVGILGLGLIWGLAELARDRFLPEDQVTDPLWKRVRSLSALLLQAAVVSAVLYALMRAVS